MEQFFPYGEQEIAYLKSRDKRLGEVIDKVGMVEKAGDTRPFRRARPFDCGAADFDQSA